MPKRKTLPPRLEKAVDAYLAGSTATAAVAAGGYSDPNANCTRVLSQPMAQATIAQRRAELAPYLETAGVTLPAFAASIALGLQGCEPSIVKLAGVLLGVLGDEASDAKMASWTERVLVIVLPALPVDKQHEILDVLYTEAKRLK